jgi:hypothetical protein
MNYPQSSFTNNNKKNYLRTYVTDLIKIVILILLVIIAGAFFS